MELKQENKMEIKTRQLERKWENENKKIRKKIETKKKQRGK